MLRFEGKTALVTGGNSGIGLAAARGFAQEGARVVITGRDQATLDKARGELGAGALAFRTDAGDIAAAATLVRDLAAQEVRLDAVFVNAGVSRFEPLAAVSEASWDFTFNVNVKGPFFLIQGLAPLLNPGAAIVLNGSVNAHIGMPNTAAYAASKAALVSLARTLSAELLDKQVRVNVISPGPTKTPLYGRLGIPADQEAGVAAGILSQIPLKRFGTPEEVASAVLYLTSPDSAFIVGSELIIDGGMIQL